MNELKRLRLPQVIEKTGWKKTDIYDKIKKGEFPKQKRTAEQHTGYLPTLMIG